MNLHANAALSLKGRRELCRAVVVRERTLTQAAEAAGVKCRLRAEVGGSLPGRGGVRTAGSLIGAAQDSAPHQ
jgi:hypothetical protein